MTNLTIPTPNETIGIIIRNGRKIYYAYIDGRVIERMTAANVWRHVTKAREQGLRIGAA